MINVIYNIIKGWYRFLFKKRSQMAKDRLLVCSICPVRYKSLCTECGCEIHAKAEIEEEECPKGYWIDFYRAKQKDIVREFLK